MYANLSYLPLTDVFATVPNARCAILPFAFFVVNEGALLACNGDCVGTADAMRKRAQSLGSSAL